MLTWLFIVSGMVACYPAQTQAAIHVQSQRIERTAAARAIEQVTQLSHSDVAQVLQADSATSFVLFFLDVQLDAAVSTEAWQLPRSTASPAAVPPSPVSTRLLRAHRPRGPPLA